MALDLGAVIDGLVSRLETIDGLRVGAHGDKGVNPPQANVSLPEVVDYDVVMGRGADRAVIPVTVLVGKVSDRAAKDKLARYVSGEGADSIKSAIDGDLGGSAMTVRVMSATISVVSIEALEYLGATFEVEVID